MFVYELMKVMDAEEKLSITQIEEDGEQWTGTFADWVSDGSPMSKLSVFNVYHSDMTGITIEAW